MNPISAGSLARCLALLAGALIATSPHAVTASAVLPDGVYAALASNEDLAACASYINMSPIAYVKLHTAAWRVLHLTSGATIYLASISTPFRMSGCYYGSGVTAFVAIGGRYHVAFVSPVGTLDAYRADGTALFTIGSRRDGESEREAERVSLKFDGTDYQETDERVYKLTGETKPLSVALQFAPGASSATVSGKVYLTFADVYDLKAREGQTATIDIHATSGMLGTISIYNGAPDYITEHAVSDTWTQQLRSSNLEIHVYGGEDETPTTYQMTVTIH